MLNLTMSRRGLFRAVLAALGTYGGTYLDHRDKRFKSGRVGLWTKADSVTAFDDLAIRGTRK